MHIGYLVQQFPPEVGAGPARVTEMALRWLASGASVTVMTGMPNRPSGVIPTEYRRKLIVREQWSGISVLRSWLYVSPAPGFLNVILNNTSFMFSSVFSALLRAARPDVLIASSPPFLPHISGYVLAKRWRIPLVLEVRDLWPDYLHDMGYLSRGHLPGKLLFALERYLLARAAHVVVVTESFKRRIVSKGVPENRVSIIPNGVDHRVYYSEKQEGPGTRSQGSDRSSFVVGYLGNFGAGQGLQTVLDAARIVAAKDPAIRFVLVGDGAQRVDLEQRAAGLKLGNLTIERAIPKEETRHFYNSCDVCLAPLAPVPVFQETVPSKIFEIMACERPVVGCFDGEARKIVEESGGGVVVPPGNSQALAEALLRMKTYTTDQMRTIGASGRRYVQSHYDRTVLAEHYFALLRQLGADPQEREVPSTTSVASSNDQVS